MRRLDGKRLRLSASDVADFVACGHLTRLDLLHARGEIQPARAFDAGFEDLVARGEAHEAAVLQRFRAAGWHVYHYNHYEPTAVDHLTELHETRQEAVGSFCAVGVRERGWV